MLNDCELKKYLRLPAEPYIEINDEIIHNILSSNVISYMEYLNNFYELWSKNLVSVESLCIFKTPSALITTKFY
jgi:hypothetical protein